MSRRDRRTAGFSLIELMVVSLIMVIVILFTTETFTRNQNAHVVIDQVSEVQQNGLALTRLLEHDIRQAGYMVMKEAASCARDNTGLSDIVVISDADAIRNADALPISLAGKDLGAEVSAFPAGAAGWATVDSVVVDEVATYEADGSVAGLDSDFRVGGGVIFANPTATPPVRCARVTEVDAAGPVFRINVTPVDGTTSFPASTFDWVAVPAHIYEVDGNQRLLRNGAVLADDVEDLQVAWFYDGNDDGEVAAGEYLGGFGTQLNLAALPGGDASLLRELRLNMVIRTAGDDPGNPTAAGRGQRKENRSLPSTPGADGRHRRSYQSTARLRNLGV